LNLSSENYYCSEKDELNTSKIIVIEILKINIDRIFTIILNNNF
jgi:hypothetical protein